LTRKLKTMKRLSLLLLILLCSLFCVSFVQADQPVPFAPLDNVTGNYTFTQGDDSLRVNTNFPLSSADIVYPDWLFGMMIAFIIITIYFGLVFISRDPAPWVSVIACGALILGLGLSAAMMAPLVGYTQVSHQIVSVNAINTIYVNEVIVYTMGTWISYACYGVAVGGLVLMIAGLLLLMKETRRRANEQQAERIRNAEDHMRTEESISWRKRDRL